MPALSNRIDCRKWWGENGLWVALFAVSFWRWLYADPCDNFWFGAFLSLSIACSAATVFRILADRWPPTRFWRPYVVQWLSWFVADLFASTAIVCISVSLFLNLWSYLSPWLIVPMILMPPAIRLILRCARDIRSVRWNRDARFGKVTAVMV